MRIIHWIGIDDHADSLTVAHFEGAAKEPLMLKIVPDEKGLRKLISYARALRGEVRVVYEAGPCGFGLYRRLKSAKIDCEVAAPSLTPRKPGNRVQTDRRDATNLANLNRGGQLTMIVVPDEGRESLRDLVRGREAVLKQATSLRHQITKLLLRHGIRYRDGRAWTQRFWAWLGNVKMKGAHTGFVLEELISALTATLDRQKRFDGEIERASKQSEYVPFVAGLRTLRGVDTLTAMIILSELGDLRRFDRASRLMSALGLVPGEASTGNSVVRLPITKAGNTHVRRALIESAWNYQRRCTEGKALAARRRGQPQALVEIARKCELRLNRKFYRMTSRGKRSTVAAVAVARELAGFVWAIGQLVHP